MIDRKIFYTNYKKYFGKLNQSQVNGLNIILMKLDESKPLEYANQYAGIIANIMIETDWTYMPIREKGSYNYFRYLIGRLGSRTHQEAYDYRGGGYIQTTGRLNYITMSKYVKAVYPDMDIVANPQLITNPDVSWITLEVGLTKGLYTGKKITDYLSKDKTDYYNFRRCINGTNRATEIAGYAEKLYNCIEFSEVQYSDAELSDIMIS